MLAITILIREHSSLLHGSFKSDGAYFFLSVFAAGFAALTCSFST